MHGGNEMTCTQVAQEVKKTVIGQDDAVDWLCSFIDMACLRSRIIVQGGESTLLMPSMGSAMIVGPTASGKSHLVKTFAKVAGFLFYSIDANAMSAEGYKGASFSTKWATISKDLEENEGAIALVLIDEIDKLFAQATQNRESTAIYDLLKPLEGGKLSASVYNRVEEKDITLDCDRCIFILAGAFTGIEDIVAKRLKISEHSVGFGSEDEVSFNNDHDRERELRSRIEPEDIEAWGGPRELVGRISTIKFMPALNENALRTIVRDCKQPEFSRLLFGANFVIDDEATDLIVSRALADNYGARSIGTQINNEFVKLWPYLENKERLKTLTLTCANGELCFHTMYGGPSEVNPKAYLFDDKTPDQTFDSENDATNGDNVDESDASNGDSVNESDVSGTNGAYVTDDANSENDVGCKNIKNEKPNPKAKRNVPSEHSKLGNSLKFSSKLSTHKNEDEMKSIQEAIHEKCMEDANNGYPLKFEDGAIEYATVLSRHDYRVEDGVFFLYDITFENDFIYPEICLLFALYYALRDWFDEDDFVESSMLCLLSQVQFRRSNADFESPLDMFFNEISTGKKFIPAEIAQELIDAFSDDFDDVDGVDEVDDFGDADDVGSADNAGDIDDFDNFDIFGDVLPSETNESKDAECLNVDASEVGNASSNVASKKDDSENTADSNSIEEVARKLRGRKCVGAYIESDLRRHDGVQPGKCGGLSEKDDKALGYYRKFCKHSFEEKDNARRSLAYRLLCSQMDSIDKNNLARKAV